MDIVKLQFTESIASIMVSSGPPREPGRVQLEQSRELEVKDSVTTFGPGSAVRPERRHLAKRAPDVANDWLTLCITTPSSAIHHGQRVGKV